MSKRSRIERFVIPPIRDASLHSYWPCRDAFYISLVSAIEHDGFLIGESPFPKIYIRECYPRMASEILAANARDKTHIWGGNGVSYFIYYLLWRLVSMRKRVLSIIKADIIYFDGSGAIFSLLNPPPVRNHEFWGNELWCVFDSSTHSLGKLPYNRGKFVATCKIHGDFYTYPVPRKFRIEPCDETELEFIANANSP